MRLGHADAVNRSLHLLSKLPRRYVAGWLIATRRCNYLLIEGLESLALHRHLILISNHWQGRIGHGVLHGGKNAVSRERLQGFRRPLGYKSRVIVFIVGIGLTVVLYRLIGGVVPLGNHNRQCGTYR